jgi:hypothetical protein
MKKISAEEFDRIFDEGEEDILQYCDPSTVHHPEPETRYLNIEFPLELFSKLDRTAQSIGVPVMSLIKVWLAERVEQEIA